MAGRLNDLAQKDWNRITSKGGFDTEITFETPDGSDTIVLRGLATKHHLDFDNETGNAVNSKTVNVTISESLFTDEGYPVRNTKGDVNLLEHRVTYRDSTGTLGSYVVRQNFPDETVGVIICILDDFEIVVVGYDPLTDAQLAMYYNKNGLVVGSDNAFGTVNGSGVVSNFKDLKGASTFNLVESIITAQPILTSDGVEFDGINDKLVSSDLPSTIKAGGGFTFILVGEILFDGVNNSTNEINFQTSITERVSFKFRSDLNISQFVSNDNGIRKTMAETTNISTGSTFINRMNFKSNWEIITSFSPLFVDSSDLSGDVVNDFFPTLITLSVGNLINAPFRKCIIKGILVFDSEVTNAQKISDIKTFLINEFG